MKGGFGLVDLAVLVVYLLGTTALGVRLGRGQKGARDYFVADRLDPLVGGDLLRRRERDERTHVHPIPGLAYLGDLGFLQVVPATSSAGSS